MENLNDRERHLLARSLFSFNVFLSEEFQKAQEKRKSGVQQEAIKFVESIWETDCKVAIENPVGILSTQSKLGKATQYIQPYWFGEKQRKKTGLWLKGFPKLVPTNMLDISKISEKELNKLYLLAPSPTRALERSKTFHGVANAIAQQWGSL